MREYTRAGLTRQTIIQTALGLLNQGGLGGLTVARLAAELGGQSPWLYWHLRSKQELLDAMADAITVAAGMGPPHHGESWQHWLARLARASPRSPPAPPPAAAPGGRAWPPGPAPTAARCWPTATGPASSPTPG